MKQIDKSIEILQAFKEGKTLERQDFETKEWYVWDCDEWELLNGFNVTKIRIKPEPKLRPYKNIEEFLKASREHGPYLEKLVWYKAFYKTPIMVESDGIVIIDTSTNNQTTYKEIKYSELLNWKWEDGTPCGIIE